MRLFAALLLVLPSLPISADDDSHNRRNIRSYLKALRTGCVELPPGVFRVRETIEIPNGGRLTGCGFRTQLKALGVPTLICQGERDPFGNRNDVAGYALAASIRLAWIDDGDHN